jgi:hypothetical protein
MACGIDGPVVLRPVEHGHEFISIRYVINGMNDEYGSKLRMILRS